MRMWRNLCEWFGVGVDTAGSMSRPPPLAAATAVLVHVSCSAVAASVRRAKVAETPHPALLPHAAGRSPAYQKRTKSLRVR